MKKSQKPRRPIYCIENDTTYKSIADASRDLNVNKGNINRTLHGVVTHAGGYHFRYADSWDDLIDDEVYQY